MISENASESPEVKRNMYIHHVTSPRTLPLPKRPIRQISHRFGNASPNGNRRKRSESEKLRNLPRVLEVLEKLDADVVALQDRRGINGSSIDEMRFCMV